jgi:UDP-N-acetylglucosamine--N-acetylmuramyl-(pentapeptide) pyrophosphoryl-undecaprenol N-acetylglucosamine transferase
MTTHKKTVVLTGGGSGGHVYPGISVIRALEKMNDQVEFHWIGTADGMESQIVPKENIPLHLIEVGKLNMSGASFGSRIKTLLGLPVAMWNCYKILKKLKPVCIFGVGGFVSGPVVLCASIMGIPTAIWEPNAHPGLSNRWLSFFVKKIFLVFDDAKKHLSGHHKIQRVGLPIRSEIEALSHSQKNIENKKLNVLIFCGSQGAQTVNTLLKKAFLEMKSEFSQFQIRHQTGAHDIQEFKQAYEGLDFIEPYEYLHNMSEHLNWADIIICRAGTGSVSEVAACRKPAIFIPLPWAADDHQTKNAQALVNEDAAYLIPQKELDGPRLLSVLEKIKLNPRAGMVMGQKAHRFYTPRAAESMAESLNTEFINSRTQNAI